MKYIESRQRRWSAVVGWYGMHRSVRTKHFHVTVTAGMMEAGGSPAATTTENGSRAMTTTTTTHHEPVVDYLLSILSWAR